MVNLKALLVSNKAMRQGISMDIKQQVYSKMSAKSVKHLLKQEQCREISVLWM
jgi:hypothetical protein